MTGSKTAGRWRRRPVRLVLLSLGAVALAACASDNTPSADSGPVRRRPPPQPPACWRRRPPSRRPVRPTRRRARRRRGRRPRRRPPTAPASSSARRSEGRLRRRRFVRRTDRDGRSPGQRRGVRRRARRPHQARADGKVVLDITSETTTDSERGLLGLAFAPDGAKAYVSYTDDDGNSRIDEYSVAADGTFDPDSTRHVLHVDQPFPNHNGGRPRLRPRRLPVLRAGRRRRRRRPATQRA